MIICRKDVYDELCKSFGVKNYSRLTKKRITDKNGHSRFVWVKNGNENKEIKRKLVIQRDYKIMPQDESIEVNDQNIQSYLDYLKESGCDYYIKDFIKNFNFAQSFNHKNIKIKAVSSISNSGIDNDLNILIPNDNSRNTMSVFFHELSHLICLMLGRQIGLSEITDSWNSLDNCIYEEKIQEIPDDMLSFLNENDFLRKNVNHTSSNNILNQISKIKSENNDNLKELLEKRKEFYNQFDKEMFPENYYIYAGLCGLLDSMSFGYLNDNKKILDGHGTKYFNNNINIVKSEILADYISMSICSKDAKKIFDKTFPKTSKELNIKIKWISNFMEVHNAKG